MSQKTFQRTVPDGRTEGKSQEEDAAGLLERAVKEDIPLDKLKTRESGDARKALITLARQKFANLAGITLVDAPQEEGRAEAQGFIQTGGVEGLTEISPEQTAFLGTLKTRYERNQHGIVCHNTVKWETVEAKLRANPAKLDALKKMDDSGGEPDMTGAEGEEFLFDDLATKLPDSRRNVNAFQAAARAEAMGGGVKLTHPNRYKKLGNEMRIVMDTGGDWVWLDTSDRQDLLDAGLALYGAQGIGEADVLEYLASGRNHFGTFRCSIRV